MTNNPLAGLNRLPIIALDGPSALVLYRDRDDAALITTPPTYTSDAAVDLPYLSDEDIAATLASTNVFGHRAFDPLVDGSGESTDTPTLRRARVKSLASCASCSADFKRTPYAALGLRPPTSDSPLYVLVPNDLARRKVHNVRQRAFSSRMPADSLKWLGNSVLVPSPELTLLLLARHLDVVDLATACMEVCGRYRLVGATSNYLFRSNRTLYDQGQLSTPRRLLNLCDRADGMWGRALVRRACKYFAPNSSSPMETVVYLLLCLPRSLGGYGLPKPLLNAKRRVTADAGMITLSQTLIPDLYWPGARLDMEYDSDEFHSDLESLQKGARRTMALRAMNVDVLSVTYDLVNDERAFDVMARMVAKRLNVRLPSGKADKRERRLELRKRLLA